RGITGSVGVLYDLSGLRIGAAMHNMMGKMAYGDDVFPFSSRTVVGAAYQAQRFTVTSEYELNSTVEPRLRLGAEAYVTGTLVLRAGAALGMKTQNKDVSVGLGVNLGGIKADYAYA